MHLIHPSKPIVVLLLSLVLLLSSLTACENRPTETAVPSTAVPSTLTPTPELSLPESAARVCEQKAVPQAAAYVNSPGAEHKIYVIGVDGLPHYWNQDLPGNLKAGSVNELEAVLCLEESNFIQDSCGMYGDKTTNKSKELLRDYYVMSMKLVAAKTGEIIASVGFASDNSVCPASIQSNDPRLTTGIHGDPITWDLVWNSYESIIHQAVANPTRIPPTPAATPLPPGLPGPSVVNWTVAVKDDFSDAANFLGWKLGPRELIANGALTWHFHTTQLIYQSQAHSWTNLSYDVYTRLVVRHTSGSAADAYGLAFLMNNDGQMAFLIQDDGNFRLQYTEYEYSLGASPAIRPGEWNTLEVIVFQGQVYLYINGTQVTQFQAKDYAYGQVGLAVIVEENPDATASSTFEFDEFEVRYP
jgi:hypothetical protein